MALIVNTSGCHTQSESPRMGVSSGAASSAPTSINVTHVSHLRGLLSGSLVGVNQRVYPAPGRHSGLPLPNHHRISIPIALRHSDNTSAATIVRVPRLIRLRGDSLYIILPPNRRDRQALKHACFRVNADEKVHPYSKIRRATRCSKQRPYRISIPIALRHSDNTSAATARAFSAPFSSIS